MTNQTRDAKEVRLVPVTRDNWRASLALGVHAEQQRFVADHAPISLVALAKAYVGAGNKTWAPYLLADGDGFVGFAALAVADSVEPPEECWLFHFFISHEYQGRGLGRAATKALIVEARDRYPGCDRLVLTVHPENVVARGLYESIGFVPTGAEVDGEPVFTLTLATD